MYTRYQVILNEKGYERILSEWQTQTRAYEEARKEEQSLSGGSYIVVRAFTGAF